MTTHTLTLTTPTTPTLITPPTTPPTTTPTPPPTTPTPTPTGALRGRSTLLLREGYRRRPSQH